jgi:predicted TIM-barrel fold metal-dependent hydrolase
MAPAACVAPIDVEVACAEVRRIARLGFRHVMIPNQPGQTAEGRRVGYNHPMFDPLWATIQDEGLPISLHVGTGHDPRTASGPGGAVVNYAIHALAQAMEPISQFCSSGILERYPDLKVVTVEAGIGWAPWLLWVMDEAYHKHHMWALPKLQMLPSDYWRRQCYGTFQDDPVGVEARHWLGGTGHLMWGNDYPHHEGTWPHSDVAINRVMSDLSDEERRGMLGETAARLYGFTIPQR